MYCPEQKNWQIYYTCVGEYTRLEAQKTDSKIVLTEVSEKKMKWIFSDITDENFHWQNYMMNEKDEWILRCDCKATRRKLDR